MKEFYCKEHSEDCIRSSERLKSNPNNPWSSFSTFCENTPVQFLFYHNNDFYLIHYHRCMEYFDHLRKKESFIKHFFPKGKTVEKYELCRIKLDRDLRQRRKESKAMKSITHVVNYIYSDATGKNYCITTSLPYIDYIANYDKFNENYEIAKKRLIELDYDYLVDELDELYEWNTTYFLDDAIVIETVDSLIKQINKLTK